MECESSQNDWTIINSLKLFDWNLIREFIFVADAYFMPR